MLHYVLAYVAFNCPASASPWWGLNPPNLSISAHEYRLEYISSAYGLCVLSTANSIKANLVRSAHERRVRTRLFQKPDNIQHHECECNKLLLYNGYKCVKNLSTERRAILMRARSINQSINQRFLKWPKGYATARTTTGNTIVGTEMS